MACCELVNLLCSASLRWPNLSLSLFPLYTTDGPAPAHHDRPRDLQVRLRLDERGKPLAGSSAERRDLDRRSERSHIVDGQQILQGVAPAVLLAATQATTGILWFRHVAGIVFTLVAQAGKRKPSWPSPGPLASRPTRMTIFVGERCCFVPLRMFNGSDSSSLLETHNRRQPAPQTNFFAFSTNTLLPGGDGDAEPRSLQREGHHRRQQLRQGGQRRGAQACHPG